MLQFRIISATFFIVCAFLFKAAADTPRRLGEVVVTAPRSVKDIGVQRSDIDSLALKDNIALSMADILTYNSSVFVKSSGRASLSTVAFRGTSPSHTQVTWNGLHINSPMLGMTDFSTIPSYFIDRASLLHGSSSVNETGGGLGGLISLSTAPDPTPGLRLQYIQGVGSFSTFDEFLKIGYSGGGWRLSTRAALSSSPNDYKYINRDKKMNIYDEDRNIIGQYHPVERNRSGAFRDLNILQEIYRDMARAGRLSLSIWYMDLNRELPLLTTDYSDTERGYENRQREHTLRSVLSWVRAGGGWKTTLRGGYVNTRLTYDYRREMTQDVWSVMARTRSRVNTLFGQAEADYQRLERWYFTASVSAHRHMVTSRDRTVTLTDGDKATVGYDRSRTEVSGSLTARWQPVAQAGASLVVRGESFGGHVAPLIPAILADWRVCRAGDITLKASASRNYRFPTLNDLYFLPGGNPDLRSERGWSYDAGVTGAAHSSALLPAFIRGGVTWFDSRIDDWIMWLPTPKGFFSPRNVKKVHAYGIEANISLLVEPSAGWLIDLSGSYSWTPSVNVGEKMTEADRSVGKQLPYVPRHSGSVNGRITWRNWGLTYKWAAYSERFTMSSNDHSLTGSLPAYYVSNIVVERSLSLRPADLQIKLAVNNLFDEEYMSVLSRPMPGINFELFISVTPRFGARHSVRQP